MGNWGISPNASDKEKIKSEWADELNGKNSVGKITYDVYSEMFDVGMDLLDMMYELGKSEGKKERKTGHWQSDVVVMMMVYTCSVCGERSLYEEGDYDPVLSNYCPFCGAKMEGEE